MVVFSSGGCGCVAGAVGSRFPSDVHGPLSRAPSDRGPAGVWRERCCSKLVNSECAAGSVTHAVGTGSHRHVPFGVAESAPIWPKYRDIDFFSPDGATAFS